MNEVRMEAEEEIAAAQREKMRQDLLGDAVEVPRVSINKYAYSCLNEEEQQTYDEVLNAILTFGEEVPLTTMDLDVLQKAYRAVMTDYGGLFWVSGYSYFTYYSGNEIVALKFSPSFTMTEERKNEVQARIDQVVAEWLSELPADADDYEKAKFVYRTLIEKTEYDESAPENQNIQSVFLYGRTVCQGYAASAAYLLNSLGIPASIIIGKANYESHAWNLVLLDGAYYYMDVTWGNSHYLDQDDSEAKHVNYGYLNVTSEELSETHIVEMPIPIPECIAVEDNYYRREGLYFTDWYPELIGEVIHEGMMEGPGEVTMKFANHELYQKVIDHFLIGKEIYGYVSGVSSLLYIETEDVNVISIYK